MSATGIAVAVEEPEVTTTVRGRLTNLANKRRREWCPIAVPFGSLAGQEGEFVTSQGLRLRAVRCEDVGDQSTIWRVFAPFAERQTIDGTLQEITQWPHVSFALHPWVRDRPAKLIPKLRIGIGGAIHDATNWLALGIEFENACMQRWHGRAKIGASGFVLECWTTFFHNSPVADVRVAIVWSDRRNPAHDLQVDGIELVTGEIAKFDFHLRNVGMADPVRNAAGEWVNKIAGPLGFIDGSGLPLIGRMLCLPEPADADRVDPDDYASDLTQDIETLHAAHEAPVLGIAEPRVWDGKCLANRNVARIESPTILALAAKSRLDAFMATLQQPASWYAPRPIGLGRNPSQTGDQQDFGATKGWEATAAGDARWLYQALYSAPADFFRGVMHYERDGSLLDPNTHPQWTTWSGRTHYNTGASPDRLGKSPPAWGQSFSTEHGGFDDEHRSQNNFATALLLTGDPLLRFLVEHYSTSDSCNVRFRAGQGYGSPRAWGRMAHTFANFVMLSKGKTRERYRVLLDDLAAKLKREWLGGKVAGPVKILGSRNDPRIGITRNGTSVESWNWEHGLLVTHLYAAWKGTGDPRFLEVVKAVSRTIVRYGTLQDATGAWWILSAVAYLPDGQPLPESDVRIGSTLVLPESGGTATWVLPAILVFIETHEAGDVDMARAKEVARFLTNDREAVDPRTAEWWACVRSVPPVPSVPAADVVEAT